MRKDCRTLIVAGLVGLAVAFAGTRLFAADDDDGDKAEMKKVAEEALAKSVKRGNELFHSKDGVKKSCAQCHENPDKPELSLVTREFAYPYYSRKQHAVVSLGQKINEMIVGKSVAAKALDLGGADLVALEAYVASLKKK